MAGTVRRSSGKHTAAGHRPEQRPAANGYPAASSFRNFQCGALRNIRSVPENISYTQTWQEAAIVGTTNSIVAETLDDMYGSQNTTADDNAFDTFRETLLTELTKLLTRTTCRRVRVFLMELIGITSAILTIYSAFTVPGKEDIADIVRTELRSTLEIREQEIGQIAGRYLAKYARHESTHP